MGRQRNNSQMKRKKKASETMLTEREASQLWDTEFKVMVIRKLTELSELKENYQKLHGNYNELTANYINMKKEIETITKGQEEMKNTISELKKCWEPPCLVSEAVTPSWLRVSQSWDHKPLRRQSLSPWHVCHLCPLHPAWPWAWPISQWRVRILKGGST